MIIDYEYLYEAAAGDKEVEEAYSRNFKMRVRDTVKLILDTWVQAKYLDSWSVLSCGKKITGVEIRFPKKAPTPPKNRQFLTNGNSSTSK